MLVKKIGFYTCVVIFAVAYTTSLSAISALAQRVPQKPLHNLPADVTFVSTTGCAEDQDIP